MDKSVQRIIPAPPEMDEIAIFLREAWAHDHLAGLIPTSVNEHEKNNKSC